MDQNWINLLSQHNLQIGMQIDLPICRSHCFAFLSMTVLTFVKASGKFFCKTLSLNLNTHIRYMSGRTWTDGIPVELIIWGSLRLAGYLEQLHIAY